MSGSQAQLQQSAEAAQEHLGTICEFSLNRPPMRAKIDVQSYDELKPGVQRALALVDWFDGLQQNFAAFLGEAASQGGTPSPQQLELIGSALDACVVLENQFSGWSNCINRFSWFKRTFAQVRNEVSASDPSAEQLAKDLPRLQSLIGAAELRLPSATSPHQRVRPRTHAPGAPRPSVLWTLAARPQVSPSIPSGCT